MEFDKNDRMLEILIRCLRGERISPKKLAEEYGVSTKSISRDISRIQNFLSDHRELVHNAELTYSRSDRTYHFDNEEFLKNKELFVLVKILLGSRSLNRDDMLRIIEKLKSFTTAGDRESLENIIRKEIYHYHEVKSDCPSVIDNLWKLIGSIEDKRMLTIDYFQKSRNRVKVKILPAAVMFSEYYLYLIAYIAEDSAFRAQHFRIDRIASITEHREHFQLEKQYDFDEGELRERNQFMFPGETIKIRFEFWGSYLQAILDRLPTAKVIEKRGNVSVIEADVNDGRGIMMYLLSQGKYLKVLSPAPFVKKMKQEIEGMKNLYENDIVT